MTIGEALNNALEFLEALGYKQGGDIHDDLKRVIDCLEFTRRASVNTVLPEIAEVAR